MCCFHAGAIFIMALQSFFEKWHFRISIPLRLMLSLAIVCVVPDPDPYHSFAFSDLNRGGAKLDVDHVPVQLCLYLKPAFLYFCAGLRRGHVYIIFV